MWKFINIQSLSLSIPSISQISYCWWNMYHELFIHNSLISHQYLTYILLTRFNSHYIPLIVAACHEHRSRCMLLQSRVLQPAAVAGNIAALLHRFDRLFPLRWKGSTTGGFSIDILYRKGKEHVPKKIKKLTYFRVKTMVSCRLSLKSTYITIIHNPCPKYQLSASGPPKINLRIYLSNTKLWFPMVLGRGGNIGGFVI